MCLSFSQVVRSDGVDVGTLLYKTEDKPYESPSRTSAHWKVSVEGKEAEEDLSERMLGRVLDVGESDGSTVSTTTTSGVSKAVVKAAADKPTVVKAARTTKRSTRAATRSAGGEVELLTGIEAVQLPKKPASKKTKQRNDPNVIKVKMLTGTLFLHRGLNRRAEFVWSK